MIFFTDQCYAIFTDRLPSKIKITKEFDNFILCTTDFWKTIKNLISLLKRKKNNYSSTSERCKKIFFKTLKRQNLQNETISELYIDILMVINQNILVILTTSSNLQ